MITQPLRSATVFSLAAEPPRALVERPDAHAEFDAAILADGDTRHPCSIQKLTAAGATLGIAHDVAPGQAFSLELGNGQSFAGTIDWCRESEAGFLFDAQIDVIGTLARNLASLPAERRAVPRVEVQQAASLRVGGRVASVRARNISQGGLGVDLSLELSVGDIVQITLDTLRPLDGVVRWVRGAQAGIAFEEELGWQTLMPWLRHAQRSAGAVAPPVVADGEGMIPDKHAIRLEAPAQVRTGVHWWNAKVRALTAQLVELETRATVLPGAQLWISLPEIGGGPASVIERVHNRILCEFRLPLRARELGLLTGGRIPH